MKNVASQLVSGLTKSRSTPKDTEYEIFVEEVDTNCIGYGGSEIRHGTCSRERMAELRVLNSGRVGAASTINLDDDSISNLFERCVEVARNQVPRPNFSLCSDKDSYALELSDPKVRDLSSDFLVKEVIRLSGLINVDPRVVINSLEIKKVGFSRFYSNKSGLEKSYRKDFLHLQVDGFARYQSVVTPFEIFQQSSSRLIDFQALTTSLVQEFIRVVALGFGSRPIAKGYTGPVLFSPKAAYELFHDMLVQNITSPLHHTTHPKWSRLIGGVVASPGFAFGQAPNDQSIVNGWTPFDREGSNGRDLKFINSGILENIILDIESANRIGASPTGSLVGPVGGTTFLYPNNLFVEAGKKPQQELIKDLGYGLYIIQISGGYDTASGDFNCQIKNGLWIENGEIAFPVSGVSISGNQFELLKRIISVGSDQTYHRGSRFPSLLIDAVKVTSS